jgi:hypothetical protein
MSMGVPRDKTPPKFSAKLESEELERIVQGRKNLDDVKALAIYGAQYKNMGWWPVALEAQSGRDLNLDFSQPQTLRLLMDLALNRTRIQLAIRLELDAPLFVLRVRPALGRSLLDRLENWRSPCIARLGDIWEHHFLALPPAWALSADAFRVSPEAPLSVLGPGELVLAPPSFDLDSQDAWRWLSPPWEQPPEPPGPELLVLLEECGFLSRKSPTAPEDLPSWKAMFPVICHADRVLQALLAPEESCELYYRKILQEALRAGFRETRFLLGLLWHAPHSEARLVPEGRRHLARWETEIQRMLAAESGHLARGAPAAPDLGTEGPAGATGEGELGQELQLWEAQASELEQHLKHLESLQEAHGLTVAGGPRPSGGETPASARPKPHQHLGELDELRRAVEEFLTGLEDLPDPE